jgi:hypothetical protein
VDGISSQKGESVVCANVVNADDAESRSRMSMYQTLPDDRYNPVLGEFFRCTYNYPDGSEGLYIAEQVSHHPVRLCQPADTDDSPSLRSSTSRPPTAY